VRHKLQRSNRFTTSDLSFVLENERFKVEVGGRQDFSAVVRIIPIFRPEEAVRRIVHRHVDVIMSSRSADGLIQK